MNTLLIPRKLQAIQTGARPGLLLPALLRHAGCAALFFLASALNGGAQTRTSLDSLNNLHLPDYILDAISAPDLNLSNLQVAAQFTIDNPSASQVTRTSVLRFRLIND